VCWSSLGQQMLQGEIMHKLYSVIFVVRRMFLDCHQICLITRLEIQTQGTSTAL
jgi:hypothetical protein